MKSISIAVIAVAVVLAVSGDRAISAQDKYTLKVPDGLAFSEFRGYEDWQVVAVSKTDDLMSAILANPAMIAAYRAGVPGNGQPFPDGAKIAKIHWKPKDSEDAPAPTSGAGHPGDVDFMVRDSKRFSDTANWGYAEFDYEAASETFTPHETGANCGAACHTIAAAKDSVFTASRRGQRRAAFVLARASAYGARHLRPCCRRPPERPASRRRQPGMWRRPEVGRRSSC